jgi:hypothetical protein
MQFVLDKALELKVNRVEILGDIYDTHAVVRLEVLEFWQNWFETLSAEEFKTVILVGNHDLTGNYSSSYSALHPFLYIQDGQRRWDQGIKIVHEPYLDGIYGYLPYIHDDRKFVEEANKLADRGAKILVSHPNYKGAVYDNGTAILNGVDSDDLSPSYIQLIGGHIHTEIEIGRVWYPGNARWLTASCANKRKGIWLCADDENGNSLSREFISTASVCTPIVSVVWKEGAEKPEIIPNTKTHIELIGSSDWVTAQKLDLKGVSISSKITDTKKSRTRKSGKSLDDFLSNHYQMEPEMRDKVVKYLGDLKIG